MRYLILLAFIVVLFSGCEIDRMIVRTHTYSPPPVYRPVYCPAPVYVEQPPVIVPHCPTPPPRYYVPPHHDYHPHRHYRHYR